jgi:hypothetical protein
MVGIRPDKANAETSTRNLSFKLQNLSIIIGLLILKITLTLYEIIVLLA